MASKAHQFIADLVARKMNQEGYEVVGFEGETSAELIKLKLPPKILRHRPDLIAIKDRSIAIGEAKTAGDFTDRTKEQLLDFTNKNNWPKGVGRQVFFGIPMSVEEKFKNLINDLGISPKELIILSIPDRLLPQDEENNL